MPRVGTPICDPHPDHVSIGQVGDDCVRAERRRPMRCSQLMSIIAFPAGGRSPLPAPTVPGRHAGLHPRGEQGVCSHGGRGWPIYHGPCQGSGDVWTAEDQAGHEHAASERWHAQRPDSRHEVFPFLTSGHDVRYSHVCMWSGLPDVVRCVRLVQSTGDRSQAVPERINTSFQPL